MPHASTEELRAHPRVNARIVVDYHYQDVRGRGAARDLSLGGIFIEQSIAAPMGTRVYLRLHLPESDPHDDGSLDIIGVIARIVEPDSGAGGGVGVRFAVASSEGREALSRFIERVSCDGLAADDLSRPSSKEQDWVRGPDPESLAANAALGVQEISGFFEFEGLERSSKSPVAWWIGLVISMGVLMAAAAFWLGLW